MSRRTVIIPRLRCSAWHGDPSDNPTEYEVADVETALRARYEGEACMTPYAPDGDAQTFPRLGKSALAYFQASDAATMPTVGVVPVDIDYDDHDEPPDGWAREQSNKVPWPHGWYRTPHGMRIVIYPNEPVALPKAESYISWVYRRLREWDVEPDEAATDWTRLFKLPRALGYDLPRDYTNLEPIDDHPDNLSVQTPTSVGSIVDYDGPPSETEELTKTYLSPIRDKHLKEKLHKGRLRAPEGQRHDTFLKTAMRLTRWYDTNDPEVPYEILEPSWASFGDKRPAELWRICEWACAQAAGEKRDREKEHENAVQRAAEQMGVDPSEVRQRVIIDTGSEQFIWDEQKGRYAEGLTHRHQLLGGLRRHAPNLAKEAIAERYPREEVMAYYSSVANRVVFTYENEGGYDETTKTLYRRVCWRDTRLDAVEHRDVKAWIESFGADGKIKKWLASVPRLDRPTCGFYLEGPPSIGKQLFALGIARIWSPESAVTPYKEMVGDWNASLKESPLIWADEKVPHDAFKANDSSVLRRIIGNDSIRIREKHRTAATLQGYPRVLITANNDDALAIREELSETDLEAIRVRLGYVSTDISPKKKLEQLADDAGFDTTREYTESWVRGGKMAEYILWLEQNYEFDEDDRLLVEGWESELTDDLPTRVGSAGDLGEVIATAVVTDTSVKSIRWYDDSVYVNSQMIGQDWHSIVRGGGDDLPGQQARSNALSTMAEGHARLEVDGARRRFWKIPAEKIARIARRRGVCEEQQIIEACEGDEASTRKNVMDAHV